jgi:hypothetical protein
MVRNMARWPSGQALYHQTGQLNLRGLSGGRAAARAECGGFHVACEKIPSERYGAGRARHGPASMSRKMIVNTVVGVLIALLVLIVKLTRW